MQALTKISSKWWHFRCSEVVRFPRQWPRFAYLEYTGIVGIPHLYLSQPITQAKKPANHRPRRISLWHFNSHQACAVSVWHSMRPWNHYNGVIMGAMASQITSLTIVYSTIYSGANQRIHQSSASLAFVRGIHRWPVNSPHKWPVTRGWGVLSTPRPFIVPGRYIFGFRKRL